MATPIDRPVQAGQKRKAEQPSPQKHGRAEVRDGFPYMKLVVRNSQVEATFGAGLGLFAEGSKDEVVFKRGARVCDIQGALVFCQSRGDREIAWMVSDRYFCGLSSDHYVMRSGIFVTVPGQEEIELGIWPDDLSLYINDSRTNRNANVQISVDYDSRLNGLTVTTPLSADCDFPVYRVLATKDILAGQELMWNYRCSSDNPTYESRVDPFSNGFQKHAEQCTQALLGKRLQYIASPMAFNEKRRVALLIRAPRSFSFSEKEKRIQESLRGANNYQVGLVLRRAKRDKETLIGYLKSKLDGVEDLESALGNLCTILGRRGKGGILKTRKNIYDFCVKNQLFSPQEYVYIPMSWLADKLRTSQGATHYQVLLRQRLKMALVQSRLSVPIFLNNMAVFGIPNVVAPGERWTMMHMESFTGYCANLPRDPKDVESVLQAYGSDQPSHDDFLYAQVLYEMVRRGSVEALKAVLDRRLSPDPTRLGSFLREVQHHNLSVVLFGERKTLSKSVTVEFVQAHFDKKDHGRILGVNASFSKEQLLEEIRTAGTMDTRYSKLFWDRYHLEPDTESLKKMLVIQCQKKNERGKKCYVSDLVKIVNGAGVRTDDDRPYNRADMYQLMKDVSEPEVRSLFIENLSDEEIIDQAAQRYPAPEASAEALLRSASSAEFFREYILRAASRTVFSTAEQFYHSRARYLNGKGFLHLETKQPWTEESLRQFIAEGRS